MTYTLPLRNRQFDVVVVDSRPQDYLPIAASYAATGVVWHIATSATDALRLRPHSAHCVWLVNMHLPDCEGGELLTALRLRDPRCVAYLVGDRYDAEDELAARRCGAPMYLCKSDTEPWLTFDDLPGWRQPDAQCA